MFYYVSVDLDEFEAWSGAIAVMDALKKDKEAFQIIEDYLENEFDVEPFVTDTAINDFLWFDAADFLWEGYGIDLFGDHEDEEDE